MGTSISYQKADFGPQVIWPGFDHRITPIVQKLGDIESWQTRMEKLISISAGRTSAALSLDEQTQVQQHLLWILRSWMGFSADTVMSHPAQRVREMLNKIDPTANVPVEQLARRAHMSSTAFRAAFRQATGQAPRQWLEARRIDQASHRLLNTNLTVAAIADEVGYSV